LLLLVAGAFTVVQDDVSVDSRLVCLVAGYVLFSIVAWLGSSLRPSWVHYLTTTVDIAAVSLFAWSVHSESPVWLLYLFGLLATASSGFRLSLFAGCLSICAYLSLAVLSPLGLDGRAFWAAFILALLTGGASVLPSAWINSAKEGLAWGEVKAIRKSFTLEQTLSRAAMRMTTFDADAVYKAAIEAVHVGLDASAFVIEPQSSETTAASEAAQSAAARLNQPEGGERESSEITLPISGEVSLVVLRNGARFDSKELAWLERLAKLAANTIHQAVIYREHCAEEERLRSVWQASPLPAALHTSDGELVYANAQYEVLV